jgi:hypothetical protein
MRTYSPDDDSISAVRAAMRAGHLDRATIDSILQATEAGRRWLIVLSTRGHVVRCAELKDWADRLDGLRRLGADLSGDMRLDNRSLDQYGMHKEDCFSRSDGGEPDGR